MAEKMTGISDVRVAPSVEDRERAQAVRDGTLPPFSTSINEKTQPFAYDDHEIGLDLYRKGEGLEFTEEESGRV